MFFITRIFVYFCFLEQYNLAPKYFFFFEQQYLDFV